MLPQEGLPPQLVDATGTSEQFDGVQLEPSLTEIPAPTFSTRIETSDGFTGTMETWELGNRDVIRVTPDNIRTEPTTGEPALPLYVALGIHGDQRLHWALTAFAHEYGGSTIGTLYHKPEGSDRLVTTQGFEYPVPELEANQADDIVEALRMLQIYRTNAYSESRGNARVEIAAVKEPDLFVHRYHQDPTGHDGERYVGTHRSAKRIGSAALRRRLRRNEEIDPLVAELQAQGIPARQPRHSMRVRRTEQKSVARMHKARLTDIAANMSYAPGRTATYAADIGDTGIVADKVRQRIEPIQATGNGVYYVETKKGRHGIGQRRTAVRDASQHFIKQQRQY